MLTSGYSEDCVFCHRYSKNEVCTCLSRTLDWWIKWWLNDIAVYSLAVGLQLDRTEFCFFSTRQVSSVLILRLMSFVEDDWRYSRPSGLPAAITENSTIQSCGIADLQFSWHSLQQISAWSLELHTCFAIGQCRFLEVCSPFPVADSL